MSDLISRKVLQREIEYLYDLNYGETLIDPREFYGMVDCQLAAYDVDKVVEQLKECERYIYDAVSDEDNYVVNLDKAISIVKGGGQA